jgi:hypothetical protein
MRNETETHARGTNIEEIPLTFAPTHVKSKLLNNSICKLAGTYGIHPRLLPKCADQLALPIIIININDLAKKVLFQTTGGEPM